MYIICMETVIAKHCTSKIVSSNDIINHVPFANYLLIQRIIIKWRIFGNSENANLANKFQNYKTGTMFSVIYQAVTSDNSKKEKKFPNRVRIMDKNEDKWKHDEFQPRYGIYSVWHEWGSRWIKSGEMRRKKMKGALRGKKGGAIS